MLVGSKIDYDEANDMTSQSWWTSNQIMSCLQFYDVALNEAQVKRTMNLCKSEGMHMTHETGCVYSKLQKALTLLSLSLFYLL